MNRNAFQQLLKKYLDGSCSAEERRMVDQWYELLDSNKSSFYNSEELKEMEDKLWKKVQMSTIEAAGKANNGSPKGSMIRWRFVAAAGFTGILLLGGLWWFYHKRQVLDPPSLISAKADEGYFNEINNTKGPKSIRLEDGSAVIMYPGSKLAFPKHFIKDRREAFLEGEAFFDISKDAKRPFFVYSQQIVTQVLGTSFDIRNKKGQVEVAVKKGKVAVYENKEQIRISEAEQKSNGVIVTPNQKVTYYQQERHFITSVVDQPIPVLKESEQKISSADFNYNETSLLKVLKDLENTYQLEIVLENERIGSCLFTGDLTDENLFNKLQGICLAFGAEYEVKGTKILLKGGKDCIVN